MLGPAGDLENIVSDTNYFINKKRPIFSIHCAQTNECDVKVITIANSEIVFPPGSFVQGAVYHIFIKKMIFNPDKAAFIGYRLVDFGS